MSFHTIIRNASKRVPLIAFRKGGLAQATTGAVATPTQGSKSKTAKAPAIEDWELHPRYWRKPIDEKEMAYINCGGPVL